MADKNLIELQIGDTTKIVDSLKDILDAMSEMDSTITSINKGNSFIEALQGGDKEGIENAVKSSSSLNKEFKSIQSAITKLKNTKGSVIDADLWSLVDEKSKKLEETIRSIVDLSKSSSEGILAQQGIEDVLSLIDGHKSLSSIYSEEQAQLAAIDALIANARTFDEIDALNVQRDALNQKISETINLLSLQEEANKKASVVSSSAKELAKFETEAKAAFGVLTATLEPIKKQASDTFAYYKKLQPKVKATEKDLGSATDLLEVFSRELVTTFKSGYDSSKANKES